MYGKGVQAIKEEFFNDLNVLTPGQVIKKHGKFPHWFLPNGSSIRECPPQKNFLKEWTDPSKRFWFQWIKEGDSSDLQVFAFCWVHSVPKDERDLQQLESVEYLHSVEENRVLKVSVSGVEVINLQKRPATGLVILQIK